MIEIWFVEIIWVLYIYECNKKQGFWFQTAIMTKWLPFSKNMNYMEHYWRTLNIYVLKYAKCYVCMCVCVCASYSDEPFYLESVLKFNMATNNRKNYKEWLVVIFNYEAILIPFWFQIDWLHLRFCLSVYDAHTRNI